MQIITLSDRTDKNKGNTITLVRWSYRGTGERICAALSYIACMFNDFFVSVTH